MEVEGRLFLQKEYTEIYDVTSGDLNTAMKLSLSAKQLQQGLIAQIGYRNFTVLLALSSFVNQDNLAFPTLEKLAEITGIGKTTLIKSIKELEQVTVGGSKLFNKRKLLTAEGNTKSVYQFIQETNKAETAPKPADYIELFCKAFEQQYGRPYVPNYGRDTKVIKDKLMSVFPAEDIAEIIEVCIRDYRKWSSNPQYPTPTIGALSWMANKAADTIALQRKADKAVTERIAEAEKAEAFNPLEQLELL